jgi:hypothetical protein
MTVPLTQDYVKPEERLPKFDGKVIRGSGRPEWGDGKTQCYFFHLELGACENNRCYYFPAPAAGSTCTGYVHCPIFQQIQKEYASDKRAQEMAEKEKREQRMWNGQRN